MVAGKRQNRRSDMLGIYAKSFMTASRLDQDKRRWSVGERTEAERLYRGNGRPDARRW